MRKKEQRRTTSELVVFNVTFWSKYTFISTMYQQLEHRITRLVLIYKLFFFTFFVCLNRYCNWTLWHALSNLKIRREICTMHLRLSVPSPHTPPPPPPPPARSWNLRAKLVLAPPPHPIPNNKLVKIRFMLWIHINVCQFNVRTIRTTHRWLVFFWK